MPLVGLEQTTVNTVETRWQSGGGAPGGAFPPDLLRVIDSWPRLDDDARQSILELVAAAEDAPGNAYDGSGRDAGRKGE
jgi:hypothetical protein